MRFRIRQGAGALHRVFARTPKAPQPSQTQPRPRSAELDNPYGRYYTKPRSREDLQQNRT